MLESRLLWLVLALVCILAWIEPHGELAAQELLGEKSALLEPFRFSRYAEGRLHPKSRSPFPWS